MGIRLSILLLAVSLALSGCWDRTEINDLAIVKAVAADKTERGILLAARIVVAKRGSRSAGQMTDLFSAEGKDIAEAAQVLQRQTSRRLFWGHAGPLIIGESLAREGVLPVLDFWSRFSEPRMNTYVIVTPGSAKDFAGSAPTLERLLGEAVREITNMRQAVPARIHEFLGALRAPGAHPVAPRFERTQATPDDPPDEVRAAGTAVFHEDRLVGWLDESDTVSLLILRGQMQSVTIRVELPGGKGVTTRMVRSVTTTHAYYDRGRLRMRVNIRPEGDVLATEALVDLGKPEVIALVEQKLNESLRKSVLATIEKLQKDLGSDVVRFGDVVRRTLPLQWEGGLKSRWDSEFERVAVDVFVDARIRRTGANSAPLGESPGRLKQETSDLLKRMR